MKRVVSAIFMAMLLTSMLYSAFKIIPAEAAGTIYIRADGSIDPPTAPIQQNGDVYTLTGDINSDADGIVVERDNIVVDGGGHTVQGTGSGTGLSLSGRSNVTIKSMTIKAFYYGIWLEYSSNNSIFGNNITANNGDGISLYSSSDYNTISGNNITNNDSGVVLWSSSSNSVSGNNITNNNYYGIGLYYSSSNSISGNNITNNGHGIWLYYSSSNSISGNNITANNYHGIRLTSSLSNSVSGNNITNNYYGINLGFSSNNNTMSGNNITNNYYGIGLYYSSNYNSVSGNNITNNYYGIYLHYSSDNRVFHNNLINNTNQLYSSNSVNIWDDGYPSGGNYWSDYTGVDLYSGPDQDLLGSDGMGDTPYIIDENNTDHYPLMNPWPSGWKLDFAGLTNHPIVDFAVYNGSLYAAANNKLYMKNGSSWNAIDAPTFVTSLEPYGDKLVVGGQGGLYCYDGTSFTLVFSVPTYVKVLGVYDNRLHAGTMLDNPPKLYYCNGSAENPADWHIDTGFSTTLNFSGAFGSIDSHAVYNGKKYVASGNTVYCFDGTGWSMALSYEYAYAFLDMQVYNGKLYLATRDLNRIPLYTGGTGFSGTLIEYDGENWTTVLGHDYWIYSLEVYDGKLYVGTANRIYTYNGTAWDVSFYAEDGAFYAISMIAYDGKIYAGMGNGYIFADPAPAKANPETIVVPEFSSTAILAVFMALTMLAAALTRKDRTKRFD